MSHFFYTGLALSGFVQGKMKNEERFGKEP
jgi:hypothetical protein